MIVSSVYEVKPEERSGGTSNAETGTICQLQCRTRTFRRFVSMITQKTANVLQWILAKTLLRRRDAHSRFLKRLRKFVERCYHPIDDAGDPMYDGNPEDELRLERYFKTGHFHKNLYTNYHALSKIFRDAHATIPDVFHVYDLACGPYTATISLLTYLNNDGQDLEHKSFLFTFCDKGDLCLEKLCRENAHAHRQISFAMTFEPFLLSMGDISIPHAFATGGYRIVLYQCSQQNERLCNTSKYPILGTPALPEDPDAPGVNLVFCLYPGIYGEPKFFRCIRRTLTTFSRKQQQYPTFIIYAHFLIPERRRIHDTSWKERVGEGLSSSLRKYPIKSLFENANERLPFRDFYHIIEL